ncbi:MAG TPA: MFS transporter [Erysipelotrichaceae bacterium]|nr:MFS transporter [Erysipelotrichaceae bacterium]
MIKIQSNKQERIKAWIFVLLSFMMLMSLGTVYSYSVFRLSIETHYSINTTLSGLPYMFALAFYSISMFISGRYIERFNPRLLLILGSVFVSSAYLLSSYSTNIYLLTLTYGVIGGTGVGLMYGIPIQNASLWFNHRIGLVVGSILIGFGLSPLVTAPLGVYLIQSFGLMNSFRILGMIILGILLIISLFIPLKRMENKNHVNWNYPIIVSNEFKRLYVNFVIGTMIGLMIIGLTSKIGIELFKLDSITVASLMSLFAVLNGLGRPLFGLIIDRYSLRFAMILSYSLIIFSSLMLIFLRVQLPMIFIVSFSIYWLNLGAWLSIAPNATRILFGQKDYSKNYGITFTAYGIGAILGIVLSGLLMDMFQSYYVIFSFVLILSSFGLLVVYYPLKK